MQMFPNLMGKGLLHEQSLAFELSESISILIFDFLSTIDTMVYCTPLPKYFDS